MSLNSFFRKLAGRKSDVQKRAKFDKINLADEVKQRSPLVKKVVSHESNLMADILRSEASVLPEEQDVNDKATLAIQQFVITSVEENPAANLISIEIVAGAAEAISLSKRHIKITTNAGISNHTSIKALIDGNSRVASLISVAINAGQGLTLVTAESTKELRGAL